MYNYFPHSSAMRSADEVLTLRMSEGVAGYGVYCMLLELLRDAENRELALNPRNLAFALNVPDVDLVDRVLHSPGLFDLSKEGKFSSPWLSLVLQEFDAKKAAAKEAGRRGAAARYGKPVEPQQPYSDPMGGAMATPQQPNTNTPIQQEERERKNPPTNSRSQLFNMSWKEWSGEDLFRLARRPGTILSDLQYDDAISACDLYKKKGIDYHDPLLVFNACKLMGFSAEMYDFLCKLTTYGCSQLATTKRLREIVAAWESPDKAKRFRPNHPTDYVLTQLIPLA